MLNLNDINNIECDDEVSELDYSMSIQRAINSGMWGLQGSYGRAMMDAVRNGACMLGRAGARDYYGNYIPGRDEIADGFPGSYGFVANVMGEDWADAMINA